MTDTVQIHLLYFASVREQLGCAQERVTLPADISTVGEVRDWLIGRGGVWATALSYDKPLRMAYRQVMCDAAEPLLRGDQPQEIAIFPPVTGG